MSQGSEMIGLRTLQPPPPRRDFLRGDETGSAVQQTAMVWVASSEWHSQSPRDRQKGTTSTSQIRTHPRGWRRRAECRAGGEGKDRGGVEKAAATTDSRPKESNKGLDPEMQAHGIRNAHGRHKALPSSRVPHTAGHRPS